MLENLSWFHPEIVDQTQSTGSEEPGWEAAGLGYGRSEGPESVLDSDCDLVYDPLQSVVLSSSTPKAFLSLLFFPCFFVRIKCEIITCEFFSTLAWT